MFTTSYGSTAKTDCVSCLAGSYKIESHFYILLTYQCPKCPAGMFSNTDRQESCAYCPSGSIPNTDKTIVIPAPLARIARLRDRPNLWLALMELRTFLDKKLSPFCLILSLCLKRWSNFSGCLIFPSCWPLESG
jgi:hypothetical protein